MTGDLLSNTWAKKKRVDNSWNKIGKMMEIIEASGRYMRVH